MRIIIKSTKKLDYNKLNYISLHKEIDNSYCNKGLVLHRA